MNRYTPSSPAPLALWDALSITGRRVSFALLVAILAACVWLSHAHGEPRLPDDFGLSDLDAWAEER